jgi:hypothetical protein
MVEDIDIWRTANLLLRQHGYDTLLIAAQRHDGAAGRGENGLVMWKRIMTAVEELSRVRADGEKLN